ncbi:hypothetical protein N0V94_005066 [Neodidymelliopsis sp. IMI 364377]|nr:hypothetical protein N0V94_005066 [Neodidymelliopsis sp. IMI 364377]
MDDVIRPSQAAKRRSLHGEGPPPLQDSDVSSFEDSDCDSGSMVGDEDTDDDEPQSSKQSRKRKRSGSPAPAPTRRSSRKKTSPKVSYNMKIHPQDSDLRRVYACDGSKSSPSANKRVKDCIDGSCNEDESLEDLEEECQFLHEDHPRKSKHLGLPTYKASFHPQPAPENPPDPQKTLNDAYSHLSPDIAYLAADSDIWKDVKGRPFQIFTERMENQLDAEAEAASPLRYDDDDKENDITNPELIPAPDPLQGISIIPASTYRQQHGPHDLSNRIPMVSNAFYTHPQFEAVPYGLGWSDGARDMETYSAHDYPMPDYLRILASSENLARSPLLEEQGSSNRQHSTSSSSPSKNIGTLELLR